MWLAERHKADLVCYRHIFPSNTSTQQRHSGVGIIARVGSVGICADHPHVSHLCLITPPHPPVPDCLS